MLIIFPQRKLLYWKNYLLALVFFQCVRP